MTARESARLRFDATTRDWVLFAPARARRPHPPAERSREEQPASTCPFCPGHEDRTPGEILRLGADHEGGWSVRVVPNKFPALERSASPGQTELGRVFREMGGYGVHEVVVASPDHSSALARQPTGQIERVLRVIHERFTALMKDRLLRAIVVFENHGERAGTSLSHPHWQIIATPVVPHHLRLKQAIAMDYFDRTSRCLHCVTLDEELAAGERVLAANDDYVAVLPFASHVAYQLRILPREHRASFAGVAPSRLRSLAEILRDVLARLDRLLGDPDYNLTLATAPIGDEQERYFLWHIDVLPRLATPAGFEIGSGMSINPVLPEQAARELRAAGPGTGPPGGTNRIHGQ